MNFSFPPIRQVALCPKCITGILHFDIIPFSGGKVYEYCPQCESGSAPPRKIELVPDDDDDKTTPCVDCSAKIPVLRQSGRRKKRCPTCAAKYKAAKIAEWRQANRSHLKAYRAEYQTEYRSGKRRSA